MMKKLFFAFIYFLVLNSWGQTEIITTAVAGGGGEYVSGPIAHTVEFSKSQTLYYPEDLQFTGTINQIKYHTIFGTSDFTNSKIWRVKMGTTSIMQFGGGVGSIPDSQLTEVFNGTIIVSGATVVLNLTTPFIYGGSDNLVIQVEEIQPGKGTSLLTGFVGSEFGLPNYNRAIFQFTYADGDVDYLIENSVPKTTFGGTFTTCIAPSFGTTNTTSTTATINFINNPAVTNYFYRVYPANENPSGDFTSTTTTQNTIANLLPAETYRIQAKTNCTSPYEKVVTTQFRTKQSIISLPHTVTFEGDYSRDYILEGGSASPLVSPMAGNNSGTGILFRGTSDVFSSWSNYDIWTSNSSLIGKASFIADLTNAPENPVFSFELKQKAETFVRVKVNNVVKTWDIVSVPGGDPAFKTIKIDLSDYIGQEVNIVIEHLTSYTNPQNTIRVSYVDNVKLYSETCRLAESEIQVEATQDALTITSTEDNLQYDLAVIPEGQVLQDNVWSSVTLPYTVGNLTLGKGYIIYLRKQCGTDKSPFISLYKSTLPALTTVPYTDSFITGGINQYIAPQYARSGNVSYGSGYLILHQRNAGQGWTNWNTQDNDSSWDANKGFKSGLKWHIDATNLSALSAIISFKLARYTVNSSYLRIVVNGEGVGPYYSPNTVNSDPIQHLTLDLTPYVGSVIVLQVEHVGKHTGFTSGGVNDAAYIHDISLTGTLNNNQFGTDKAVVFPNPFTDDITVQLHEAINGYSIISVDGKIVTSASVNGLNEITITAPDLQKGVYILSVDTDTGTVVKKIIKQ